MRDVECPHCGCEFEAEEWDYGQCPQCGREYGWDSQYDEESGDEFIWIDWDIRW